MKSLRNTNRRPTHPGEILREDVLPALGVTQAVLASHLGVSRLTVSEILHEKRGISAEMAVRIARVIGGTPQSWLHMQEAVDIWEVEQKFQQHPESAPTAITLLAFAA
ncbi:HigA family addiction module antidote protein [Polynucleobacter sp. Ross1-W9]|uniref:HigA family addiction module antitoxin n=1 Tax=Polynucleobacter parvulilacunae TaxID=1855631 RepID=UPI001C0BAE7D|nr:HigA family addiction module antitoxin [Polynucleobacter parvulilacunae]MBU3556873.1 HigA family addiction module antidote protein [Polynucleobacter parvulilacunae]